MKFVGIFMTYLHAKFDVSIANG